MDAVTARSPPGSARPWGASEAATTANADGRESSSPMTFTLEEDSFVNRVCRETLAGGQHTIFADGTITEHSAAALRAVVQHHGIRWARVVFNSPGGSLMGGLKLGEAIRDLGFDTDVGHRDHSFEAPRPAICASAGAYAFAGGVNRYFAAPHRLGVHQFCGPATYAGSMAEGQVISGRIVAYLTKMDVDGSAFAVATLTDPSQMLWLTEAEATRFRLANNGVRPTTAEIRLCEGKPYLRLEQTRREVTARALFMADGDDLAIAVGVVTDPETTRLKAAGAMRAYLEIDGVEVAAMSGDDCVHPEDGVLWVRRRMTPDLIARLLVAEDLDVWTENGSAFRWGAQMDVSTVRSQIAEFLQHFTSLP